MQDEFFYSMDNHLLVDRGSGSLSSPGYLTTDEYVWLGQRPVLVMRGRLDVSDDTREADTTTACGRNDESEACGPYFIITDGLPKPIALLDTNGKHARKLKWDTFGKLNVVEVRGAKTAHPYPMNQTTTLFSMSAPSSPMELKYRYLFDGVDTEGTAASPVDRAELKQANVVWATVGGYHRGRVTSSWIQADGGSVNVTFKSTAKSCPPTGCWPDGGPPDGVNWLYSGVELSAYEVAEREPGAKAFDVNLRFPGQYFDAETGKHENWNRYYDPATGTKGALVTVCSETEHGLLCVW